MGKKVEIKFEAVVPDQKNYPQAQILAGVKAMENALRGKVAKMIRKEMLKTVRGWEHSPEFRSQVSGSRNVVLTVYPAGQYGKRWSWIDQGTKSRTIVPKRKRNLAFQPDYSPKTTPGGRRGGPGAYSGDYVRTRKVSRHSIAARGFREKIVEDIQDDVIDTLSSALAGAFK